MPKPKTSPDLTPKPYRLLKSDIAAKLSARSTGGNTYIYVDEGDDLVTDADVLVKLTGTVDLDLLVDALNN